jgi:hypothetical protein
MMTTDSSAGIYEEAVFPINLRHDPDHVLDGMLLLRFFSAKDSNRLFSLMWRFTYWKCIDKN